MQNCLDCNAVYIGQTGRNFYTWVMGHLRTINKKFKFLRILQQEHAKV